MSWITDRWFWRDTAERALSSAGQGLITGAGLERIITGMTANGAPVTLDVGQLALAGAMGAALMAVFTVAKCLVAAGATRGNPSIGAASVPAGQVVEQVRDGKVVAGEANEIPTGAPIRDAGSLDTPYVPQRAAEGPEQH